MASLPSIRNLAELINPALNGSKLDSFELKPLTKPGDNYGSILLSIEAQLRQPDGKLVKQRFVGKVPPTDPQHWQFVQPERTQLTENEFYKMLVPAVQRLQDEAGIAKEQQFDGFARYYGARQALSRDSNVVDHDAILVLEDLRDSNYVPGQRLKPFDLAHTELALKYMAQYHALPIALKLKKSEVFEAHMLPHYTKFDWHGDAEESKASMTAETLKDIRAATNNDEKLVARVTKILAELFEFLKASPVENNIFNSIVHMDYWIMNLMFKYDAAGQPTRLKILDFQLAQFDSIIHDIIPFLFTSISTQLLEQHYEQLLQLYYDTLISCLAQLGANTADYSYAAFRAELKRVAYLQVAHAIFMTRFILADEVSADLSQVLHNSGSKRIQKKLAEILRLAQKFDILY
ncbi:uncharacterized protein LOC108603631 [Drosophila busckii]|uniref:uncharacterized protein LOC108603631 n=1 Tax=Drosophila busckii TaxID=30019 RepID=UPI001432B4D5|nr:uncharacterized protein LOC108603631 [Drosophila busckii]